MANPQNQIDRRSAIQRFGTMTAATAILPLVQQLVAEAAFAADGSAPSLGVSFAPFISAANTTPVPGAEWEQRSKGGEATDNQNRIAQGATAVGKAPADASRYSARSFLFPTGALRVLTWKKDSPVFHQITFETGIFVLQGALTLAPLYGYQDKPVTVRPGDVLYFPSGTLSNLKPAEDTVILLAYVGSRSQSPKRKIIHGKDAKEGHTVEWMDNGKAMFAHTPEEIAKAPRSASRFATKKYTFEGNELLTADFPKGAKTATAASRDTSKLLYVTKGRIRRTEGDQTFDLVAGDVFHERMGVVGSWEAVEPAQLIAIEAPLSAATFAPEMVTHAGGANICAMLADENGRSHSTFVNIPLKKVSDTESLSEKQDGLYWRIGYRPAITQQSRSSKDYVSDGGPYEMHVGGDPHFVGLMAGHLESTHQNGSVWRLAPGDFNYVGPGALHHSSYKSEIIGVMFNLFLPGTAADTKPPVFK